MAPDEQSLDPASGRIPVRHFAAVHVPARRFRPLEAIGWRIAIAVGLLTLMATIVMIQRTGYTDDADGHVSLLDAFYYAAVSATTTGFGDISPTSDAARLLDLVVVTPARVAFLIVLVGTTIEALTEQSRRAYAARRWRKRVKDHHIICGYGSTGRSAISALIAQGVRRDAIVVIEQDPEVAHFATDAGHVVIEGDATRTKILEMANIDGANVVIIAPNRDDTAVLATLTARELNPEANIAAVVREAENLHLLKQSGASSVIHAAEAVGRLLGMSTQSPAAAQVMDDLLFPGSGYDIVECDPEATADGGLATPSGSSLLGVFRGPEHEHLPANTRIEPGDRLVVLMERGPA